jgi:transcriptional regulator GlxA family with amidase domain
MDLSAGTATEPPCVARALVLINQGFGQRLSVSEMARHGGLSVFHFSRVFHKTVGQSPHEFLTATRMRSARELLEHSDLGVGEIAKRTGYRRPSHFTQAFKERTGMTPSAYRSGIRRT